MLTGRVATGREREGRIKTNPLCELVLVAMATIITSHLGEQEQGEGGRKNGTEVGEADTEAEEGFGWRRTRK